MFTNLQRMAEIIKKNEEPVDLQIKTTNNARTKAGKWRRVCARVFFCFDPSHYLNCARQKEGRGETERRSVPDAVRDFPLFNRLFVSERTPTLDRTFIHSALPAHICIKIQSPCTKNTQSNNNKNTEILCFIAMFCNEYI